MDSKVSETMNHYYDTQAWIPRNVVFVNQAAFDELDEAAQIAVAEAAAAAEERGWTVSQDKTKEYLEQLAANRMTVQPPSPELQEGLKKIGEQLTTDWLTASGEGGQAILEAYRGSWHTRKLRPFAHVGRGGRPS